MMGRQAESKDIADIRGVIPMAPDTWVGGSPHMALTGHWYTPKLGERKEG